MKILFTGGGTGGHVNPALAIAETVKKHAPECEIAFVGTPTGIENKLVGKAGYKIHHINIQGLQRKLTLKNIKTLYLTVTSVSKAKKLLKLTLDDGTGVDRIVASGIAKWYKPEDLIGKKVILVANLKPAVLCGVESCGMILAADCSEDDVKVIFVDGVPAGSKVR